MSAESIEWHEDCLKNALETEQRQRVIVEREIQRLLAIEDANKILRMQIARAKRLGKKSFDPERFAAR